MKKRTVILVLAMVLSLSIVGCGNNAEPKQEVKEQETKQEEQKQEETKIDTETEQEFSNSDIVIKVEDTTQKYLLNEFEYEDAEGTITPDADVPIYCEEGYQIGHINAGATIEITGHGINSAWYRFENPISGTQFDYIYIDNMYVDASKIYCESLADIYVGEEQEEETVSTYDEILLSVGYDKDKTYTEDEYIQILTKVFEEMGKKYNEDVEKDFIDYTSNKTTFDGYHVMMSYYSFDFSDYEKTLENTKNAMSYVEGGLDGASNITEFAIGKGQKDGEETINIYVKVAH